MPTWGITKFSNNEIISCDAVNSRIQQINNLFPVPISEGGTGATTAEQARENLSVETYMLLYQNVSGTSNTITLPTKASSCNRWGIFYGYSNIGGYQEYDLSLGGTVDLHITYMSAANNLYIRSALAYINKSARTITLDRNQTFVIYQNNNYVASSDKIVIYNVIGFK